MFVWCAAAAATTLDPAKVAEVAQAAGMPVDEVSALITPLLRDDSVLARLATPAERKAWHTYLAMFLTEERLTKGRAFRERHRAALERAEAQYGVPQSVILGIIGVETMYGEKMGADAVATALFTLGFYHAKRGAFFREELGHYLRLALDERWDLYGQLGSYAGAMGMGQFMPSSYRKHAVDFDLDGDIDLFRSPEDAIGSVANYLAAYGWDEGGPVLLEAVASRPPADLLTGLDLTHTIGGLRAAGVVISGADALDPATPAHLYAFEGVNGTEYRVGLQNFWVITRYNRSALYARAVTELSTAL